MNIPSTGAQTTEFRMADAFRKEGDAACAQAEYAAENHGKKGCGTPGLFFTGTPFQVFSAALLNAAVDPSVFRMIDFSKLPVPDSVTGEGEQLP